MDNKQQAIEGMGLFFNQFGSMDAHTKIVLEVLFEELYGRKTVSVPSKTGQDGIQVDSNIPDESKLPTN
jgi:hypothetical protein